MIRPLSQGDVPRLLELLSWMDQDHSRGVMAPDSRSEEGLAFELAALEEDNQGSAWVLEEDSELKGYTGLYPFWEGGTLEGPVIKGADGQALLRQAVEEARRRGLEALFAFPLEANKPLRSLLEAHGFQAQHTTYFFSTGPRDLSFAPPAGIQISQEDNADPEVYRDLYRRSEDGWSLRLTWTDEELAEHFDDPGITLFVAYQKGKPVGLVELEHSEEAEISYLGVVPEARGQGVGRALLGSAATAAFALGAKKLRVRAHDHEKKAQELYRRLGFALEQSVVTYALELRQA